MTTEASLNRLWEYPNSISSVVYTVFILNIYTKADRVVNKFIAKDVNDTLIIIQLQLTPGSGHQWGTRGKEEYGITE